MPGPQSSQIYACYSCKNARTHSTNAVATPLWGVCIFGGARSGTAHSAVATRCVLMKWVLVQSQRFDSPFVNCAGNLQAVIALEVRQGRSRVNAQRTRYFSIIIPCILQSGLDIRDHFIRE